MQVDGKTLAFDKSLWVQYGGVDVEERDGLCRVTGREEEGYLKVFNHFGRLLKLYTFEDGLWTDVDTGGAPLPFDESQTGRLPAGAGPSAPDGKVPAGAGKGTRARNAAATKPSRGGTTARSRTKPPDREGARGGKARKAPPGSKTG
jgi:hypothetical protein